MPKLSYQDYDNPSFHPDQVGWSSRLPSSQFLENTTLDPSLVFEGKIPPELTPFDNLIPTIMKKGSAQGTLWQQQFLLYDVGTMLGVPAGTVDAVTKGLQGFSVTADNVKNADVLSDYVIISTGIGAAGSVLSAIPTIYTQIAGAIINLGIGIGNLIVQSKAQDQPKLPLNVRSIQGFDGDTDEFQFNDKVRGFTQNTLDYSPLFYPRFKGPITAQLRESGSHVGLAWGLGNGKVDRGKNEAEYNVTGGIGFIPGAQRITSLIQTMFTETPKTGEDTIFDPRCGKSSTAVLDVGEYYPGTSSGCLTIWDWANKLSQVMYSINTPALDAAWIETVDNVWVGIEEYWDNSSYENWWGCASWESAVQDLASSYCEGIEGRIGGIGAWAPNSTKATKGPINQQDRDSWEASNIYARFIKNALWELRERQVYYLQHTVIAAYLPSEGGAVDAKLLTGAALDPAVTTAFIAARKRILETEEKHWVRLDDVQDPTYADAVEAAGGGWVPQHQGDLMAPGAPPEQPVPGIAIPPDAPPPPKPPNPGGGVPFGIIAAPFKPREPEPSWLQRYGPYIAGAAAVAGAGYMGYRAYKRRKPNGLYLPPGVG